MCPSASVLNGNLQLEKKFFHKICCHSATSLPKPLCFKHIVVVAARWEVAARPHPQPLHREGSGCAQGGRQVVTSNDSPKLFTTVKTAFSCGENGVFQRRKRHFPAWQRTHCAQPPPSFRGGAGGGAGFAATSHLAATTTICLKHSGFGRLVAEWQQKQKKIFFLTYNKLSLPSLGVSADSGWRTSPSAHLSIGGSSPLPY